MHLQHEDFSYRIKVTNSTKTSQDIVFRIFLAPIKDHSGRPFSFREQRLLMIELDKFVARGNWAEKEMKFLILKKKNYKILICDHFAGHSNSRS